MITANGNALEEMRAHLKAARDIADAAEKEGRAFTDIEAAKLRELMEKATAAKARHEKEKGDAEIKAAIAELGDGIGLAEKSAKDAPSSWISGAKSLGEAYIASPEYKALLASVPGGHFGPKHRVVGSPVGFEALLPQKGRKSGQGFGQKALVTGASDTSAGAFILGDDMGLQVGLGPFQRPLTLRDLVTNGVTDSDQVEYVRVTSVTNNASPVAEATSAALPNQVSNNELQLPTGGGYKPESGLAVARVSTPVRTIAHWIPVTKRALSDAAQMITLIDSFLQYGLEEELEDQMIAGNGTGEQFEGLASVSGVQSQSFDTDILTTTRKAKTLVRTVGRAVPNAFIMHPEDVETLDLLADNENRYYFGGPQGSGMPGNARLWNLPVIESEALTKGTAYVGDFSKAVLWDRQQATITTTDSHGDFFVRNLVAILAEMRAAFGVLQPSAFVEIELSA